MSGFLDYIQTDSFKAAARNLVSWLLGAAAMFGVLTVAQQHDLIQAWGDIQSGAAQMAKGLMVVGGILGPVVTSWWAAHKASTSSQMKTAAIKIAEAAPADRLAVINSVADLPEVRQVAATPAVARATASSKVVSS